MGWRHLSAGTDRGNADRLALMCASVGRTAKRKACLDVQLVLSNKVSGSASLAAPSASSLPAHHHRSTSSYSARCPGVENLPSA